jgi:hypothetical protein
MISRRLKHRPFIWSAMLLLALLVSSSVAAQDLSECLRIVAQSLADTGVNCANNASGAACYAAGNLESVIESVVDKASFDEPGETIALDDVITLAPGTMDLTEEAWGITVFNMQANLPTNFDRSVVVLGFGGVEMESGVPRDTRFKPLSSLLTVTTNSSSELRMVTLGDPDEADVIGEVAAGVSLPADAVSEDGLWVRVVSDDMPAWISAAALEDDISSLPVYGPNHMTSFQSFFLRPDSDDSPCNSAPSLLVVQAPSQVPVDIVVNCVPIRIESTIILRARQVGAAVNEELEIATLFGMATINADSGNPIYVPPGFLVSVGFDDLQESLGIEGDEDEWGCANLALGQSGVMTQDQLDSLSIANRLPNNLLNYSISLPRLVIPSGIGAVIRRLIFDNPRALDIARRLCNDNILPDEVCDILGL